MLFDKLFKKKPNDKAIKKFWAEFESLSDLFADILQKEEEDGEDYVWMQGMVRKSLKLCVLDSTVGFDFGFERNRDPVRFVFYTKGDAYLRAVGERMNELYPRALTQKIQFTVEE